jgi:hypothetical protein
LEYEALGESGSQKITYKASKIDISPVPLSKFEISTKGYRIL